MFALRFRVFPIMAAVLFVVSLFAISIIGRAAPAKSVHDVTITGISATGGQIVAGSSVTIKGTGFAAGARVIFNETAATDVKVVSDKVLTATVPTNVTTTPIDVTVFVGTEGASFAGDPQKHGSKAVVHGYNDGKKP